MILLVDDRQGIIDAGERIRKRIVELGREKQFPLDLSIGVASFPEHGEDSNQLIRLADRALYIAKKRGDKIHIGEEEYELDDSVIHVVFQPIVDTLSGKVIGHEALSQASTEEFGIQEFFRKYRSIGKLLELKEIFFRKQIEASKAHGLDRVFINVDFKLLEHLGRRGKPAGLEVILEISEKEALIDIKHHLAVAQEWRAEGFKFALDDFGVGFISLPFLADLEPEYIKLDRLTILQAVASDEFRAFLNHVVLGLRQYARQGIVAEGIESEEELAIAQEIGIPLVQGYLFGEPGPINHSKPGSVELPISPEPGRMLPPPSYPPLTKPDRPSSNTRTATNPTVCKSWDEANILGPKGAIMRRMGSILMLLAILATPAQGQGRMRGLARADEIGDRDRGRDLPADLIIRLRDRLSLSEEQVERIKEAQRSDREARDALRLETRGMRDRLRDEEITRREFREEMADRRAAEVDGMMAYRETLEGILTDEQRSRMQNLRRRANRGRGVGRNMRPAGGGRALRERFRRRGQRTERATRRPRHSWR